MSLTSIPGLFLQRPSSYANPLFTVIDAAGEMAGSIMRVPANGDITKVGVNVGNVTTSKPLRVSLQTVNAATGLPTGSYYKGSTQGVLASIASNTFYQVTLGTQATSAVKNDFVAIVAEWDSGDFGSTRIMNYCMGSTTGAMYSSWGVYNTGGGGWTKNAYSAVGSLEYSDGTHYCIPDVFGFIPGTATFNSGTGTADEYGNVFNLPVDIVLHGFMIYYSSTTTSTHNLCYYTGSTLTEAVSILGAANDGAPTTGSWRYIPLANDYTINKDTTFRLTIQPTNTQNVTIPQLTYPSSSQMSQDGFSSAQCQQTTQLNVGGSFTDTTTKKVTIYPWITKVQDSTGGDSAQKAYSFIG